MDIIATERDRHLLKAHSDGHRGYVVFELTGNAIPYRLDLHTRREQDDATLPSQCSSETWFLIHPDRPAKHGQGWEHVALPKL